MSFELALQSTISLTAGEDLSLSQYKFVAMDGTSQVNNIDATNTQAFGILQNQPSFGPNSVVDAGTAAGTGGQIPATVAIDGVCRLRVAKAYPAGTFLTPQYTGTADENGRGIGVSDATGGASAAYIRAYTLQTSTAADDIVAVKLVGLSGLVS